MRMLLESLCQRLESKFKLLSTIEREDTNFCSPPMHCSKSGPKRRYANISSISILNLVAAENGKLPAFHVDMHLLSLSVTSDRIHKPMQRSSTPSKRSETRMPCQLFILTTTISINLCDCNMLVLLHLLTMRIPSPVLSPALSLVPSLIPYSPPMHVVHPEGPKSEESEVKVGKGTVVFRDAVGAGRWDTPREPVGRRFN